MEKFNFNDLEMALINAAKVASQSVWFNVSGCYYYFEVMGLLNQSLEDRLFETLEFEEAKKAKEQAVKAYTEIIEAE